ncbi:MAG: Uncharacterised protein [Cryomorphaceae bacterium]|nr:MAG: Uncharacterised protein [Cryomorphaceae bacterium]
MNDVLSEKGLVFYFADAVFTITAEDDDVVDVGTIRNVLVFLHACTYKTFFFVDVQFLISDDHLRSFHTIERSDFCFTLTTLTKLLFEVLEVVDRKVYNMLDIVLNLFDLPFNL